LSHLEEYSEAVPIAKIVSEGSDAAVGWVYLWNTGETGELWLPSYTVGADYLYLILKTHLVVE
jgi:hypothetical protein